MNSNNIFKGSNNNQVGQVNGGVGINNGVIVQNFAKVKPVLTTEAHTKINNYFMWAMIIIPSSAIFGMFLNTISFLLAFTLIILCLFYFFFNNMKPFNIYSDGYEFRTKDKGLKSIKFSEMRKEPKLISDHYILVYPKDYSTFGVLFSDDFSATACIQAFRANDSK